MPLPLVMTDASGDVTSVTAEWLVRELRGGRQGALLLLDCRAPADYQRAHVAGALHSSVPPLMLRRLKKGNLNVESTLPDQAAKERFLRMRRSASVVVYDEASDAPDSDPAGPLGPLVQRLRDDDVNATILRGGFRLFQQFCDAEGCPQFCQVTEDCALVGMQALTLGSPAPAPLGSPGDSPTNTTIFPVKVTDYVYLGNKQNAEDLNCLLENDIHYILNVTEQLPNAFEHMSRFTYMKIPIRDHWSENLGAHFHRAIHFIDMAVKQRRAVLIHCLAGISRSVTVTVAYLMFTETRSLNDAYDVVRRVKKNIAPNFNFMGQLLDFERALQTDSSPEKCECDCRSEGSSAGDGSGESPSPCRCAKHVKAYFSTPTSLNFTPGQPAFDYHVDTPS